MIHDLGHPPFGHNGEAALDACMAKYGGFEGNAQTLRIITRLEKLDHRRKDPIIDENGMDQRIGLNLTVRSIASGLKYDKVIPNKRDKGSALRKGYYASESNIVEVLKHRLGAPADQSVPFKTIECSIMDHADDIAYSTYDLEDMLKSGMYTPLDLMSADSRIYEKIADRVGSELGVDLTARDCQKAVCQLFSQTWKGISKSRGETEIYGLNEQDMNDVAALEHAVSIHRASRQVSNIGYLRTEQTSVMIDEYIRAITIERDSIVQACTILTPVAIDIDKLIQLKVLKQLNYELVVHSSWMSVAENRGYEIVRSIFDRIVDSKGTLLPEDAQDLYHLKSSEEWQYRVVCDFIAGMTDRYAIEYYDRLFGGDAKSIFKSV